MKQPLKERFSLRLFARGKTVPLIGAVIAFGLFSFGLSYPMEFRVRGDASEYLQIATHFDSFSDALSYTGERTIGFPLLEYTARVVLSAVKPDSDSILVNFICALLLAVHLACAWLFSGWALRAHVLKSTRARSTLFLFLATYPALIGYTTTPLTDTLAVDIALGAVVTINQAFATPTRGFSVLFAGLSGSLFALSTLVRPAYLPGVASALLIAGAAALTGERRKRTLLGFALAACALVLAPVSYRCAERYGEICLQSPNTFDAVRHAQMGLRGARLLWFQQSSVPTEFPVLPDEFMVDTYYRRCHLTSLLGLDSTSLTGCLLSRPQWFPVYLVKKWIGLFDHFRFTPYVEQQTPFWLCWWSRGYDSLAWIGFALGFLSLLVVARRLRDEGGTAMVADHLPLLMLVVFSVTMLAEHTLLHVEDRFSLPVLPLCALLLVAHGEGAVLRYKRAGWRSVRGIALYSVLAWALFIAQIISWDDTPYYASAGHPAASVVERPA